MGSERAKAMEDEAKNPYGRPAFLYVNQDELERLGITQFRAAVGDNIVRIIPPLDIHVPWAKRIFIHRHIGANNSTFLCPNKMFNKPCPVCERAKELQDENADKKVLSAFWPKLRHLMFLYDVTSQKEEEKGLRWWDAPASKSCAIVENIVALSRDPKTGAPLDVSDPETGRDVKFTRKGTDATSTTYMGYQLLENGVVPKEWHENVPTFESVLEVSTYDHMYKELHGVSPTTNRSGVDQSPATGDEKETPVSTEQKSTPAVNQMPARETGTRRSYGNAGSQGVSEGQNNESSSPETQSINQRLEDIKKRRAARVNDEEK